MFFWDPLQAHFLLARRVVSVDDIRAGAESAVVRARADLQMLAERAVRGEITGAQWAAEMPQALKRVYVAQEALARGGWQQLRESDLANVEGALQEELRRVRRFSEQVNSGQVKVNSPQFVRRTSQYADRARGHYENTRLDDSAEKRGHNEFRRLLGARDHCEPSSRPSCAQAADMGWVPRDRFIRLNGCTCDGGCHCIAQSRIAPR